jgi:ATP-dependent Lhr-like helicase
MVEILRARLSGLGPVTAEALARSGGLARRAVDAALVALEGEGFAMQGRFTPGADEQEWCERRLLARIHRTTLDRLRREIEPVTKADFARFLLVWQRVLPDERVEGPEGLAAVLEQLSGFEAPAAAWESEILPARIEGYDPLWLDALCLSGRFVWRRVSPPAASQAGGPIRTTPIAILHRETAAGWIAQGARPGAPEIELGTPAAAVRDFLAARGASFFADIVAGTGLLRTQVENALGELVAGALVTADSFTGLRALLAPSSKRPPLSGRGRRRHTAVFGMENAGRWSLLAPAEPATVEDVAWTLLRRYGVVFRAIVQRESLLPPWRELLRAYRRLEARGEIRGGRFADGFTGEQYALSDAVARLRAVRRAQPSGALVSVSGADPLNLVGIVVPGDRVAAQTGNRVLYRDGIPIAVHEAKESRFLVELGTAERWEAQNALIERRVPPQLRAYLGRSA